MILDEKALDTSDKSTRYLQAGPVAGGGRSEGDGALDDEFRSANTPLVNIAGQNRAGTMSDGEYLRMFQEAQADAVRYVDGAVRGKWARSVKAFHNEHFAGSKYLSEQWKSRSKLFRPKTRVAVRKQMSTLVKALFGTNNVIAITPQDEADDLQAASAAMKQQLVNYRLDRKSRRNAVPWMPIVVGARQDSLLHGIAISKQTWSFVEDVEIGEDGDEQRHVVEDRPEVILYPPENVLFSPLCDWRNPAQSSEYLILRQQMSLSDVLILIQSGQRGGAIRFDDSLTRETLMNTTAASSTRNTGGTDTVATRAARHDGADPNQSPNKGDPKFWLAEVFYRVDGKDMVFWVLDDKKVISTPVPVRQAYPHMKGERPIVIGYGSIEAHRALPMSPVESWQPLQAEINDLVNLRLDHMKQVVTPLAKVRRGRNIDIKAVQSRGGNNGVVMLGDKDDLDWAQIPDLPQSAYVENQYLNADFDDAAGTFNSGSVQTNRSLNETVGGMKLLAGDANQIGDFDLTIFVETFLEPVVWQIVKAIEYFETDATVLAIAGKKAKLVERYGITDITDEFLMAETHVSVKIGIGVSNMPMERLQKFGMAGRIFGEFAAPFVQSGKNKMPSLKLREVVDTVFGDAGIPDAADRFFNDLDDEPAPEQQGPPPELQIEQAKLQMEAKRGQQEMAMEQERHQQEMEQDREKFQQEHALRQQDMAFKAEENRQNAALRMQQAQQNAAVQGQVAQQKLAVGAAAAQQKVLTGDATARQKLEQGDAAFRQKQEHAAQALQGGAGPSAPASLPAAQPAPTQPAQTQPDIGQLAQAIMALAQAQAESNAMLAKLVASGAPQPAGAPQAMQ